MSRRMLRFKLLKHLTRPYLPCYNGSEAPCRYAAAKNEIG